MPRRACFLQQSPSPTAQSEHSPAGLVGSPRRSRGAARSLRTCSWALGRAALYRCCWVNLHPASALGTLGEDCRIRLNPWAGAEGKHQAGAGSLRALGTVPAPRSAARPLSSYPWPDFLQRAPDSRSECENYQIIAFLTNGTADNFLNIEEALV